jgi:hypothetical protein
MGISGSIQTNLWYRERSETLTIRLSACQQSEEHAHKNEQSWHEDLQCHFKCSALNEDYKAWSNYMEVTNELYTSETDILQLLSITVGTYTDRQLMSINKHVKNHIVVQTWGWTQALDYEESRFWKKLLVILQIINLYSLAWTFQIMRQYNGMIKYNVRICCSYVYYFYVIICTFNIQIYNISRSRNMWQLQSQHTTFSFHAKHWQKLLWIVT